ncbi:hypothetical protein [Bradyrhizobium lablabi]|uniref:hypothetical protein n=1 Tax=Bradyrhizobium lablabi TaxID=722472 RepID=UPI00201368B3|nr:hypothetical protein [Bradyrhizobium lablabi]
MDKPEAKPPPLPREAVEAAVEEKPAVEERPPAPEHIEADGYSKVGPGPIASIRFKWMARRAEDGHFYVDETIGDGSAKVTTGPMSRDAAIKFVDDREREARQRFDSLRSDMTGRSTARKDSSEA